jgi:hypothetical protein
MEFVWDEVEANFASKGQVGYENLSLDEFDACWNESKNSTTDTPSLEYEEQTHHLIH